MNDRNAREELLAAAGWLAYQHEDLSFGLKNAEDAVKLWRAWTKDENLPEFCDEADSEDEAAEFLAIVKKALGYNPWQRAHSPGVK
jgi:hypothetical protein